MILLATLKKAGAVVVGLLLTLAFPTWAGPGSEPGHTLEFVQNKGQWPAAAHYAARLPCGRLFAEADGFTYALYERVSTHAHEQPKASPDGLIHGHALKLRFVHARAAAPEAAEPTAERRNFFLGADPRQWASDVRGFRQLRYPQLWPGIGARVYENAQQQLEYDFEVAPGASPKKVVLRYDGADRMELQPDGSLRVHTQVGYLTELAPKAWQTDPATGLPRPVACRYVLSNQEVRFELGAYDHRRALIIDPTVVFSSYTGSTADNWGFTATYDDQGNLYSGGIVFSPGYPVSPGAFTTLFRGVVDMGIIKYNTTVTGPAARIWATYLGGSSADFPHSLVVNAQNELLVLGSTSSANFPTTAGALQTSFAGGTPAEPLGFSAPYDLPNGSDLVVARLSTSGSALVASTYLGGSGNDGILPLNVSTTNQLAHNYGDPFRGDILTDAAGNVYIASHTASNNFPTARGFAGTYGGGTTDAVVCKLTPGLTALVWSSFLGGSGADAAYSVQLAAGGDVYVAGGTLSTNFPGTAGGLNATARGGGDGFVARIGSAGNTLVRATYLGTPAYDQAYFVQIGTDGGVYVLGQTLGAYPTTAGRYLNANGRQFIHKLTPALDATSFATVFGSGRSTVDLSPTAFLVDRCDRVYVSGWGGDLNSSSPPSYLSGNGLMSNLPITPNAVQSTTDGSDFYLVQFSAGITSLGYATYFGQTSSSEHVDGGTSRFDPRGVAYQAVCSCFSNSGFPIPPGANFYSATNNSTGPLGSGCNNAAFKLNFETAIAVAGADQSVCETAAPFALTGAPAGGIWSGPGVSGSVATGFFFTPSPALLGVQQLTYTVLSTGLCTTSDIRNVSVTPRPAISFAPIGSFCLSAPTPPGPVQLAGTPAGGVFSGPGVAGSVFSPTAAGPGTFTLAYSYTQPGPGGCTVVATQSVSVGNAVPGPDQTVCATAAPVPLLGSPAGGVWSGPGVSGSLASGFFFTPSPALAGGQRLTYTLGTCFVTRLVTIPAVPRPVPTWDSQPCPDNRTAPLRVRFQANGDAGFTYSWNFDDGTQGTGPAPEHVYAQPGTYRPVLTIGYGPGNACTTSVTTAPVEVAAPFYPNIITPNGDSKNDTFRPAFACEPRLRIYSRWGQQVYHSDRYRNDWGGEGLAAGLYYYLLEAADGRRVRGIVELAK